MNCGKTIDGATDITADTLTVKATSEFLGQSTFDVGPIESNVTLQNSTGTTTINPSPNITTSYSITLPQTTGYIGQILSLVDNLGTLVWASPSTTGGSVSMVGLSLSANLYSFLKVNALQADLTYTTKTFALDFKSTGSPGQVLTWGSTGVSWIMPNFDVVLSLNPTSGQVLTAASTGLPIWTTTNFDAVLALNPTSGQVLTAAVSGLPIWTTPPTPTNGTITSVTASAPLSSSGGTTPNITLSSLTGTGSTVVLDTDPTLHGIVSINGGTTPDASSTITGSLQVIGGISSSRGFFIQGNRDVTGLTTASSNTISTGVLSATSSTVLQGVSTLHVGTISAGTNVTLPDALAIFSISTDAPLKIGAGLNLFEGDIELGGGITVAGISELVGDVNITGALTLLGGTVAGALPVTGVITALGLSVSVDTSLINLNVISLFTCEGEFSVVSPATVTITADLDIFMAASTCNILANTILSGDVSVYGDLFVLAGLVQIANMTAGSIESGDIVCGAIEGAEIDFAEANFGAVVVGGILTATTVVCGAAEVGILLGGALI